MTDTLPMPQEIIDQLCEDNRRRQKIELLQKLPDSVIEILMSKGCNFDPEIDSDTEDYKKQKDNKQLKQEIKDKLKNLKLRRKARK